ncbi:hypothetical protein N9B57_01755 [Verrucomicrobia bacterium]|nr:hypothetical protein [Verrucomicrobiota bacterium]
MTKGSAHRSIKMVFLGMIACLGMSNVRAARPSVTFSRDIAPIAFVHCSSCHRPGGGGPFNLVHYNDFKKRSKQVMEVVESRFMPPWHAVKTDYDFANDATLSDDAVQLIREWVLTGAPEGDPKELPPMPKYVEGWELGQPDIVLTMDLAYQVPADGPDIYRYFGFPLDLPEDRWVRALEYRPGCREVAHHALVFATDDKNWRIQDAEDEAVGFKKWTGQGRGSRRIISWALGMNARVFPDGIGLPIRKGEDLVLQAHFHPSGTSEEEISKIGIYLLDRKPERESIEVQIPQSFGSLSGIEIPAGVEDYTLRESFVLPVDVKAYSTSPHAHYIGKKFELNAYFPTGDKRALLRVDDWDFAWQHIYRYQDPLLLPAGTRLETVIQWDNSAENPFNPFSPPKQINWGPYSEDEMGSILLDVVAVNRRDEGKLNRALREYRSITLENLVVSQEDALSVGVEMVEGPLRKAAAQVLERHDVDRDGRLSSQERSKARQYYREKGYDGGLQRGETAAGLRVQLNQ